MAGWHLGIKKIQKDYQRSVSEFWALSSESPPSMPWLLVVSGPTMEDNQEPLLRLVPYRSKKSKMSCFVNSVLPFVSSVNSSSAWNGPQMNFKCPHDLQGIARWQILSNPHFTFRCVVCSTGLRLASRHSVRRPWLQTWTRRSCADSRIPRHHRTSLPAFAAYAISYLPWSAASTGMSNGFRIQDRKQLNPPTCLSLCCFAARLKLCKLHFCFQRYLP